MIKKDISQFIYERHGGMTREDVDSYTDQLLDLLQEVVLENPDVTITHFGRFRHKVRPIREIIMPSGDKVLSASGERLQFLPSPQLKTRLNARLSKESES